jgi:MAF protein
MFSADASDVDETRLANEPPDRYVLRLAEAKARAILGRAHLNQVIIGADTAVVIDGDVLGKPKDLIEADQMLKRLRGRAHQVYTGIAVLRALDDKLLTDLCITDVPMRDYTDEEIRRYVMSGDPLDKAGAYAIQHREFRPVGDIQGCFAGVMGLPLCHLTNLLHEMDVDAKPDIAAYCQNFTHYACPVYRLILRSERKGDS